MKIREIAVKTVLTKTGIRGYDYCVNPYVGCAHGCTYCYAVFMKRFTGHKEPWGAFVDVKVNAPDVLAKQLRRIKSGNLLVGTVTDPYQPAEKRYGLTGQCLKALRDAPLHVSLLTRSPLCLRDIDLFRGFNDIEVGVTVSTDSEEMRKLFEPGAPPIASRIEALKSLHKARVRTYAFVGPMLPLDPDALVAKLSGAVDVVLIDRLNYSNRVKSIYRKADLTRYLEDDYFMNTAYALRQGLERAGIPVSVLIGC